MYQRRLANCGFALLAALMVSPARAGAVSYNDALPLVPTNSIQSLHLQKFDASLGALQSIELTLSGHVEGMIRYESRDSAARLITMDLAAKLEFRGPDSSILAAPIPMVNLSRNPTAYDGALDFAGTSGGTINGLSANVALAPIDLPIATYGAMFTGTGLVALPVIATGQSTATGGGNVIFQFSTLTSAAATITYNYIPVPEPTTLGLLLTGLVALRRRR